MSRALILATNARMLSAAVSAAFVSVAAGSAVAYEERAAILLAGVAACGAFAVIATRDSRLPRELLFVLLAGVLVANKTFATIGTSNVYIMDALLALALAGVFVNAVTRRRMFDAGMPNLLIALFIIVGVVNLMRGTEYGVAALKDSVINFYALAMLLPIALFASMDELRRFLRRLLPAAVVGALLFVTISLPGSPVFNDSLSIVMTAATVEAATATAFLLLVLQSPRLTSPRLLTLGVLLAPLVIVPARSVWVGCAVSAVAVWAVARRERATIMRRLAGIASVAILVLGGFAVVAEEYVRPAVADAMSFVVPSAVEPSAEVGDPVGNSRWRLDVWRTGWDNRIRENVLVGEGFGRPALVETSASADGDERTQFHNGYLSYLLREGLVGLVLFFAIVAVAVSRLVGTVRGPHSPVDRMAALGLAGGIFLYLGNAAFAVILEGPMGGILFWLLLGCAFVRPSDGSRAPGVIAPVQVAASGGRA